MATMKKQLTRNTRLVFSSVDVASSTVMTPTNTWEVKVLAGYTATQDANRTDVSSRESGETPAREEQAFNDSLNPASLNFSTYLKTTGVTRASATYGTATNTNHTGAVLPVNCWFLLQAAVTNTTPFTDTGLQSVFRDGGKLLSNTTVAGTTANTAGIHAGRSAFNVPAKMFAYMMIEDIYYKFTDVCINQFTIDGSIDNLGMVNFECLAENMDEVTVDAEKTRLKSVLGTVATDGANTNVLDSSATWACHGYDTMNVAGSAQTNSYVYNSVNSANVTYAPSGGAAVTWPFGTTAVSVTYNNNIEPLTPAELATLNAPVGFFAGTRSVTSTFTTHLDQTTGSTQGASEFMHAIHNDTSTTVAQRSNAVVYVGGRNYSNCVVDFPAAFIEYPQIETGEDVAKVVVNLKGQLKDGTDQGEVEFTFTKGPTI